MKAGRRQLPDLVRGGCLLQLNGWGCHGDTPRWATHTRLPLPGDVQAQGCRCLLARSPGVRPGHSNPHCLLGFNLDSHNGLHFLVTLVGRRPEVVEVPRRLNAKAHNSSPHPFTKVSQHSSQSGVDLGSLVSPLVGWRPWARLRWRCRLDW